MTPIILSFVVVVLMVCGQILWKLGFVTKITNFSSLLANVTSPLFIVGTISYMIAALLWVFTLNKYELHKVYPLVGFSFVLALIASHFVLHEAVSWMSWLGAIVITAGVIIIGFGFK